MRLFWALIQAATTSCALVTPEGEILSSSRRLLTVEDGARGLMQSQGLFQHVKNLPQMVQNVMADVSDAEICAVCASTRPRPAEDSYMPVFRAGESQARAAASLLRVPFYPASHQEGHVRAAMVDAGIDETKPFLALHLSGGTTEILLSEEGKADAAGRQSGFARRAACRSNRREAAHAVPGRAVA